MSEKLITVCDGYEELNTTLIKALEQAQNGKGKERHAKENEPFAKQIICEVTRRLEKSPVAFPLGQAVKKIYETVNLDEDRSIHELYGAINYIAAAIIVLEELKAARFLKAFKSELANEKLN